MRLLWLTENYYPNRGGMAQSCDRITYNLRQKGVHIALVHFTRRPNAKKSELYNGQYLPYFPEMDLSHTLNLLWKELEQRPFPDAIVAFGGTLPMLSAPIYAQWMERPLITLIRGNDFDSGIFTPRKRDTLLYALEQSAQIATVSQEKSTKINLLLKSKKAVFLPNGIEMDTWAALPSDYRKAKTWRVEAVINNKKVIGLFGHLKAKKGVFFFIKSLLKFGYQKAVHLLIIGELEAEIATLLSEALIPFSQLPFLDRNQLIPYYLACDVVAIPSFYDGMPNVLLEAGALGIPVIAARTDGMADVLGGDFEPLLFGVNKEEDLNNSINYFLCLTPTERKKIAIQLKEKIHNYYSQEIETDRYFELFKKTIHSVKGLKDKA